MSRLAVPNVASPWVRVFARQRFREGLAGWMFILPAVLGLLMFRLFPVVASLYLSFTTFDIVTAPKWVGFANYVKMFTDDGLYIKSLQVTAYYSALAIPLSLVVAFSIALLMNQRVKGISFFRTAWYLPSLVPAVANGALWGWLLNRDFGPINYPLKVAGFDPPGWLVDPEWTIPSLVLIHLWGVGNATLILLAGLQGVPQHLYEAAEVDGASWWDKFCNVTIPMTSAIIFFNLIIGIAQSFQVFALVYVLFTPPAIETGTAGPENSALVYVLYLYRNAFQYFKHGYASAMAIVLFLLIMLLTYIAFRSQDRWVYYEAQSAKR